MNASSPGANIAAKHYSRVKVLLYIKHGWCKYRSMKKIDLSKILKAVV